MSRSNTRRALVLRLREVANMERMGVRLPEGSYATGNPTKDSALIREATRLYRETCLAPLLDEVERILCPPKKDKGLMKLPPPEHPGEPWQDRSTAPTDGTRFLGRNGYTGNVYPTWFQPMIADTPSDAFLAEILGVDTNWWCEDRQGRITSFAFHHWRPLDPQPENP